MTQQRGEEEVRATLEKVWLESRPQALERVATLERLAEAIRLGAPDQESREIALAAAHRLSGALGVFGFGEASCCAAEIESLLAGGLPPDGATFAQLVARLRTLLEEAGAQNTAQMEKRNT